MSEIREENWTKTENTKIKKDVERNKIFSSAKERIAALFQMRLVTNCSQDLIYFLVNISKVLIATNRVLKMIAATSNFWRANQCAPASFKLVNKNKFSWYPYY